MKVKICDWHGTAKEKLALLNLKHNSMNQPFVDIQFHGGKTQRFFGAREAAQKNGYPDVPAYLFATGQVDGWCEEVPKEIVEEFEKAQAARHSIRRFLLNL